MFTLNKFQADQIAQYCSIDISVEGYWSTGSVSIRVKRDGYDPKKPGKWVCEVSNSSGGQESNYDSLKASENFAHAILAAVEYCRELQANIEWLEQCYQDNLARSIAKYEAERAAKQALIDVDAPVGLEAAKKLVAEMNSSESKVTQVIIRERGDTKIMYFVTKYRTNAGVKFMFGGNKISRAELINRIADSSAAKLETHRSI